MHIYRAIRAMDFDLILQNALSLEHEDLITHSYDHETGLDIFNYKVQNERTQVPKSPNAPPFSILIRYIYLSFSGG
jgi:hypothetical protein